MNAWQRIEAAVAGRDVDRIPWAFWRHFPGRDTDAKRLADATLAFQRRFGFDLVKVTPAGGYVAEAWGGRLAASAGEEGARDAVSRVVARPEDWRRLRVPPMTSGVFARELEALRRIRRGVGRDVPVLQTIFGPLSAARSLSGDLWRVHLRHAPDDLRAGLEPIAEATAAFAARCLDAGADGLFFAVQTAVRGALSDAAYRRFGEPYDRRVLDAVRGRARLIVLHVHGLDILFDRLRRYPVQVLNWHDRRTAPSLRDGLRSFPGACLGGLDESGLLRHGTPDQVRRDVERTVRQTGGRRIVLGAGCVLSVATPEANLWAVERCRG
jgi:uroporphyrinogen decarboxylase